VSAVTPRLFLFLGHEQFPPDALLRQAIAGEQAGFDGFCCSDHLQPWWEDGESGHAWPWLGAAAQATSLPFGTAVTPAGARYHPVLIAQAWATLEIMFPGRPFLGFGSGESLNESPLGAPWPPVREQVDRMEEALVLIHRLFDGERISERGRFFATDGAVLHSRPRQRPPIYVSAFGPRAARVAARQGDGLWTLADPEQAPPVIDAYRAERERLGRAQGEIVLQASFSWAPDDDAALAGTRVWKGAQPSEFYREDWHDPTAMQQEAERQVSDEDLRAAIVVSSDPAVHVERMREVIAMGATTVALANNSGADPLGAIRVYGEQVLPALRAAHAAA
jgi:coenzyme F420-dependent glucose-6-phosphate dehydrogenase